ncbi:efflux RND transporter periplasmic adaptor subunit [Balneatrix alpica]|uniref:efflux RND transporter periplasmic adaptor subunit n=1 Tax=Balneatrix alpica TaxID=75684 RepID=UPI00273A3A17|nr:efflux RND transporter periplasmic adaptor subunit [Balneatrix alpica]
MIRPYLFLSASLSTLLWLAPLPASADNHANDGERKPLYYRNPMGLPDTSPVPKKDSMGMDYIPVYADDEPSDSGVVKVSPARLQTLGVKTAKAQMQTLDAAIRAVGRVEINERLVYSLSPRFSGWIEQLYVNANGDPVKQGQPLFSLYSPELEATLGEIAIARQLDPAQAQAKAGAQALRQAASQRLANWQVKVEQGRLVMVSPLNGVVLSKSAVAGMGFSPGTPLYQIADLSHVWVLADVYEQDLARIKVGEAAQVSLDAYPGRLFSATITYLYPTLNTPTRTTPVRLELDNSEGILRPGMFAHVELAASGQQPRLTVPKSAVIDTGERQVVLKVLEAGKFQPQPVQLGLRGKDAVEILSGLEAGTEVVTAANFLIDAESNLKAALAQFNEAPASAFPQYQAKGVLESVDLASLSVTLTHEPIAELQWPGMTMDFQLDSEKVSEGLLPGQPITFSFEDRGDGEFVITSMSAENGHGGH